MTAKETIKAIQRILCVADDGLFGPKSKAALDNLLAANPASEWPVSETVKGKATSFADPADIAAFKKCKAQGKSDQECFKVGDNGIGYTGLDVTTTVIPYVAVQPDYMIAKWGDVNKAAGKGVIVTIGKQTHTCIVGDRMPWVKNTKNGAVIDLAPGAQKLFGLKPPFSVDAEWRWA